MAEPSPIRFTLGSASPRRADLLASAGFLFDVKTVDVDEDALVESGDQDSGKVVERIARAKFAAFPANIEGTLLLTADTMVACDGVVLGKPESHEHLTVMLEHMSGQLLTIATAVCVGNQGARPDVEIVATTVALRSLAAREIQRYVNSGIGMDKAGGLALQAQAGSFIQEVEGCWSNVLGLPLCAASRMLDQRRGSDPLTCSVELCGHHDG